MKDIVLPIAFIAVLHSANLFAGSNTAGANNNSTSERRPQPGDKLGYTKEESERRLSPIVKEFLDGLLRLYNVPALFANKSAAIAALGTSPSLRHWLPETDPPEVGPRLFVEPFDKLGVFGRPAWKGRFKYLGWRTKPYGKTWYSVIDVHINKDIECVDSRAVEGYLDLFLDPGLDGRDHPVPSANWDRHKWGGTPTAKRTSELTPGITLGFFQGCLTNVAVGDPFDYKDISDDDVFN